MTKSYPLYTDDPRGEKKGKAAEESSAKPGVENSKKCVTSVTSVTTDTSATPQNTEPAGHTDPVDEEIGTCACGRPADRYTATGHPICSECVEAASEAPPGDAAQNTESPDAGEEFPPLTDDDFIIADDEGDAPARGDAGDAKFATLSDGGESEVVL